MFKNLCRMNLFFFNPHLPYIYTWHSFLILLSDFLEAANPCLCCVNKGSARLVLPSNFNNKMAMILERLWRLDLPLVCSAGHAASWRMDARQSTCKGQRSTVRPSQQRARSSWRPNQTDKERENIMKSVRVELHLYFKSTHQICVH